MEVGHDVEKNIGRHGKGGYSGPPDGMIYLVLGANGPCPVIRGCWLSIHCSHWAMSSASLPLLWAMGLPMMTLTVPGYLRKELRGQKLAAVERDGDDVHLEHFCHARAPSL